MDRNWIALIVSLVLGVAAGLFDLGGGWAFVILMLFSYVTNAVSVSLICPRWSVLFGGLMNTVTLLTVVVGWYENYPNHTSAEVQSTLDVFSGYEGLFYYWLSGFSIALVVGLIVSFIVRWRSLRRRSPSLDVGDERPEGEEPGVWPPAPRGPLP